MDKLRFFRSVCNWGNVIFTIMRVFSIIGAVFALLGVLCLSFLPAGLVKMETNVKVDLQIAMAKVFGETWVENYKEVSPSDIGEGFDQAEINEEGIFISQSESSPVLGNRAISLVLSPAFVKMLLSFFLFGFIAKAFDLFKRSAEPLRAPVQPLLQRMGWMMMALGSVPGLCVSLITLITQTEGLMSADYDLFLLFAGFLVWAFSDLLTHAKSYLPPEFAPNYPQDPGDSASSGFDPNAF